MLQKFEIQGVHATIDDRLKNYVTRKLGTLDRYLPRNARESAHAEIHLKVSRSKVDPCLCEALLYLPHETIIVKEKAFNLYASVDIVEEKMKQQLQKYKELHDSGKMHQRLFARFKGQPIG